MAQRSKMKWIKRLLLLPTVMLFSMPVSGCSIEFHVVSKTDGHFQARWDGPWFRTSSWHWLEKGHAFDYDSWGSMATCHGHWKLKIPKTEHMGQLFFWDVISIDVPQDAVVTAYIYGSDDDGYEGSYAKVRLVE